MSLAIALKQKLHAAARRSGASVLRARRQPGLRILKFHGVGGTDYPVAALEAELEFLRRHFRIVSLRTVVERVRAGNVPDGGEIALTFDDGLRNNYTLAYPVLKRLGAPATFYVCPELIEGQRWLWNHEARARLATMPPGDRADLARTVKAPVSEPHAVVAWMKSLPRRVREGVEVAIRAVTPRFEPTLEQRERFDMMTRDEVVAMDRDIVTVGAHTMTHPVLPLLEPDELTRELRESQRWLEARLGRRVEHFCYPFGEWDARVAAEARRWYGSAVTSAPGRVERGDDLFGLRRISATPRLDLLVWRLHRPEA